MAQTVGHIVPKVFLATPMYGGACMGLFTQGCLCLSQLAAANGIGVIFRFIMNESLITRGRNMLAHEFLQSDATHLFFVDADIGFNPHDVLRMLVANKEVLGGVYPKKEINWRRVKEALDRGVDMEHIPFHAGTFVLNLLDGATEIAVHLPTPLEVEHLGTGFLLIKREVFEALKPHVPTYIANVGHIAGQTVHEFFATSIDPRTHVLLSEDYHFCRLWRECCGGRVFAAPWVQLAHVGTYAFQGSIQHSLT
jgi:hypothetical protein